METLSDRLFPSQGREIHRPLPSSLGQYSHSMELTLLPMGIGELSYPCAHPYVAGRIPITSIACRSTLFPVLDDGFLEQTNTSLAMGASKMPIVSEVDLERVKYSIVFPGGWFGPQTLRTASTSPPIIKHPFMDHETTKPELLHHAVREIARGYLLISRYGVHCCLRDGS